MHFFRTQQDLAMGLGLILLGVYKVLVGRIAAPWGRYPNRASITNALRHHHPKLADAGTGYAGWAVANAHRWAIETTAAEGDGIAGPGILGAKAGEDWQRIPHRKAGVV
jgi:hypothetical protein